MTADAEKPVEPEPPRLAARLARAGPFLIPNLLAFTTFLAGAILLFSGATPSDVGRLAHLRDLLPLPVLQLSHFLGSIVGVWLLLLARGLQRRVDAAFMLTAVLLAFGIVFSILKGFDYEEAIALGIMLAALLPCRHQFERKASLLREPFTPGWIAAVALILGATVWLVFFSYQHVEYSDDLWWRFALHEDPASQASRSLRGIVGAAGLAVAFAAIKLMRPAAHDAPEPTPAEREEALAIVRDSPSASAHLALLGDKSFLFSPSRRGFVMYAVEGRSWVAMGDPVGPAEEAHDLVWAFRELTDRHDGWPVYFQIGAACLPIYLDLGMTLLKIGEQARVPLAEFDLEAASKSALRYIHKRLTRDGCAVEVLSGEALVPRLAEIRAVSDAWLALRKTREKGFSLGFFDPEYLGRCPVAVVTHAGKIVAFANLWLGGAKEEASVDLMRHHPGAPKGTMDFLLVDLLLRAKAEGFAWFDLGMAPMSGLPRRPLAPLWSRFGAFIYERGGAFYNFQGLRQYKEKFEPVWEPKYLAVPGGLSVPGALTSLAALTSGGLRGVVGKAPGHSGGRRLDAPSPTPI